MNSDWPSIQTDHTEEQLYLLAEPLVPQAPLKRKKRCGCCCLTTSILLFLMSMLLVLGGVAALVSWIVINHKYPYNGDELHWDWRNINVHDAHFPKDFLWGVATSAHQVEGNCTNNQWYLFERKTLPNMESKTPIRDGSVSGRAADMWNRWSQDIQLMKNELHVNAHRFSIEWSKVEPARGQYSQEALKHYHDMIDNMIANGVEPIVTIHHFTDPIWFSEMGAFEKEENIAVFVGYCAFIFNEFKSKVNKWITINAINVYAMQGYQQGVWPPGKQDSHLTAHVMKNMVEAHVQTYYTLKNISAQHEVGLVLNMMQFDPYNSTSALDRMISAMVEKDYKQCLINFFKTGVFHYTEPGVIDLKYENPRAKSALDFIGLNYYGNVYTKFAPTERQKFKEMDNGKDIMTDMPHFPIYPEGVYRAIVQASTELQKPVLISENGIADAKDDRRELFINRYLYAVSKAIKEGHKVIGFMYWSLTDAWEWNLGFEMKFGLYELDKDTMNRKMRKGARAFIDIVKKSRGL